MNTPPKAACSCGQLTLTHSKQLGPTSMCHCTACRQRTGSIFGLQLRLAEADVTIDGTRTTYVRVSDEGNDVTLSFCPTCGTTLFWRIPGLDGSIIVAAGAFQNVEIPAPTFSVYEDRMPAWLVLPETIETHWG